MALNHDEYIAVRSLLSVLYDLAIDDITVLDTNKQRNRLISAAKTLQSSIVENNDDQKFLNEYAKDAQETFENWLTAESEDY